MKQLKISPGLALPLDAVTQKIAILGMSGSGKSYCMTKLAEEMLDERVQLVLLDPKGEAWGLRLLADGRTPGYPVPVFGGEHADYPLKPDMGRRVAELVVRGEYSAVIDVSEFISSEIARFGYDFATTLLHLKKQRRSAMCVMVDEAQDFIPQNPQPGSKGRENFEPKMLHAFERLQKQGRATGVGLVIAGQRPQEINKKVLNLCECWVTFQMAGLQERTTTVKIIGEKDREAADTIGTLLPRLEVGRCYVWSPRWLKVSDAFAILPKKTFDSSATPEVGARKVEPRKLSPVDIEELTASMQDVIEEEKAKDPAELRKKIRELGRELKRARKELPRALAEAATKVETKTVEVPAVRPAELKRIEGAIKNLDKIVSRAEDLCRTTAGLLDRFAEARDQVQAEARGLAAALARATSEPPPARIESLQGVRAARGRPRPSADTPKVPAPLRGNPYPPDEREPRGASQIKAGARRMLEVLAAHSQFKVTRAQLATLARMKVTGGTFQTYFSTLRREGLIAEENGEARVTREGLDSLGMDAPPEPQTTEELLAQWRPALKRGAAEMLDRLVEVYPDSVSKEQLAEARGMAASGGTFQTYLSTLRRNGLAVVEGREVRASETLFFGG